MTTPPVQIRRTLRTPVVPQMTAETVKNERRRIVCAGVTFLGRERERMREVVVIGSRNVEMASNAATPLVFKRYFGTDLMKDLMLTGKQFEENEEEGLALLEQIKQLAFVMHKQATSPIREYMTKQDKIEYYEWLEEFEEDDFYDGDVLTRILALWNSNIKTTSTPKNASGLPRESSI